MGVTRGIVRSILAFLVVAAVSGVASAQGTSEFRVIVHASNTVDALSAAEVARFFMEDDAVWADGAPVVPVDLVAESPLRVQFSRQILGKDVAEVKAHWRRLIFSGAGVPPPTRESESEVVLFVAANRNSIGYVSKGESSRAGIKVITVRK